MKFQYRPDIDALRAFAVLLVVGYHFFPHFFVGGYIGVDVFFVISGYLISTIIFKEIEDNNFSFFNFYQRRIQRLFPALVLLLLSSLIFGWFALFENEYKKLAFSIFNSSIFLINISLWLESGYFDDESLLKPHLNLWSLAVEEQFYLIWPFFAIFIYKIKDKLRNKIILLMILTSLLLSIIGSYGFPTFNFYSPITRFWEPLIGCFFAYYNRNQQTKFYISNTLKDILIATSLLSFLLLALLFKHNTGYPGYYAIIPVILTIMYFISDGGYKLKIITNNKLIIYIGLISYPLYLFHWPILSYFRIVNGDNSTRFNRFILLALTFIISILIYEFIEKKYRSYKNKKITTIILIATMFSIGMVAFVLSLPQISLQRSIDVNYNSYKNEFVRPDAIDRECLNYLGVTNIKFEYCRYSNVGSNKTVLLIGDSHAHAAFIGIAEIYKQNNINTLLLAASGCPTFPGIDLKKPDLEVTSCKVRVNEIFSFLNKLNSFDKVIVSTRGEIYLSGIEFMSPNLPPDPNMKIGYNIFSSRLADLIDYFRAKNIPIYYLTENPELKRLASTCFSRPFRLQTSSCDVPRQEVDKRQLDTMNILSKIKGITIIDSRLIFCDQVECHSFNKGNLLYYDDDHLSISGSKFQAISIQKTLLENL